MAAKNFWQDKWLYGQYNQRNRGHCGVHPFSRPRLDLSRWAVNVRCFDGVDLSALRRRQFAGANPEEAAKALYAQRK